MDYKKALEAFQQDLAAIDSKYSTSAAFEAYKSELKGAGRIVGKPTNRQRGKPASRDQQKPSNRVQAWQRFVTMLPVTPKWQDCKDCNLVKFFLYRQLERSGYELIMNEFMYQRTLMDTFAVQNNRAVEFEIKLSREDYLNDFGKLYYLGPQPVNKHAVLAAGEGLVSKFYFVVPANMVDIRECPAHAGLIWFTVEDAPAIRKRSRKNGRNVIVELPGKVVHFRVVKYPPLLHTKFIAPNTYQTIAKRLYVRLQNMIARYSDSIFFNTLKAATYEPSNTIPGNGPSTPPAADQPATTGNNQAAGAPTARKGSTATGKPANTRKSDKRRQDGIQDPGRATASGRGKKKGPAGKVQ